MIPVAPQPEPDEFDRNVRQPGVRGLPELKPYWRECLDDLELAYCGICAYRAVVVPPGDFRTVDHFRPKSRHPELSYEWSNYRFASIAMNRNKGEFEDVVDPFEVGDHWFRITDMISLEIEPGPDLDRETRERCEATINRLQLNGREATRSRKQYWLPYRQGELSYNLLRRWSPFVAREAERHGLLRPCDSGFTHADAS